MHEPQRAEESNVFRLQHTVHRLYQYFTNSVLQQVLPKRMGGSASRHSSKNAKAPISARARLIDPEIPSERSTCQSVSTPPTFPKTAIS